MPLYYLLDLWTMARAWEFQTSLRCPSRLSQDCDWTWTCSSNSNQKNLAIKKMRAKLPTYRSLMKSKAFPSKVTKFYEGLTEQTYTCNINGQVHDIVPPCKQDPTKCW